MSAKVIPNSLVIMLAPCIPRENNFFHDDMLGTENRPLIDTWHSHSALQYSHARSSNPRLQLLPSRFGRDVCERIQVYRTPVEMGRSKVLSNIILRLYTDRRL